ncbi:MAG: murein biosynthesis integral membrane protein MurJ [Coriobacteriales bacterium]|jgi:putative peptidoglycan lipid II flippase|nr:murein biosynthesis integral membrane protein MurJ [Coriobacteriales bacterium]
MIRFRNVILLVLTLGLLLGQMAFVRPAEAASLDSTSSAARSFDELWERAWQDTPAPTIIRKPAPDAARPIIVLYVPGLRWEMITREHTPHLHTLIGTAALANLSAPFSLAARLEQQPACGLMSAPDVFSPALLDAQIDVLIRSLPSDWPLVISSSPALVGLEPIGDLSPVVIRGEGMNGYVSSTATRRTALVTGGDLVALFEHLDRAASASSAPGGSLDAVAAAAAEAGVSIMPTRSSVGERLSTVEGFAHLNEAVRETKEVVSLAFLTLVFVAFSLSVLLLVLGRREKKDSRALLIPVARILCLVVLSYPPATFLMFLFVPFAPSLGDLYLGCALWVAGIAFVALLVGYYSRWVNSLIALFALSVVVLLVGQLFGGPLDTPGYLTYDIAEGSRYYGMGNEQGAVLFGSWITLSGLLINRFPKARWLPFFRTWGYALGSLALLFVTCAPTLGASFGPLIWGTLGLLTTWWVFNGHRLRWWFVLGAAAGSLVLAIGALYADVSLNAASHMKWVIPSMQQGFPTLVHDIILGVWRVSTQTISSYVPGAAILFLVLVVILLFVIRVFKPGSYREFWQRNTAFRVVYSVCFVMAAITFFLEDSGVFTPALLLIYPISALVWLVCDLHSWHLRTIAVDGRPLTLGELQKRALAVIAPAEGMVDADSGVLPPEKHDAPADNALSATRREEKGAAGSGPGDGSGNGLRNGLRNEGGGEPGSGPGSEQRPSVGRSTATMAMATMLSRATGFLRTWAMAFALGNTMITSAYSVANNLPNMLYELVAGGVLTTAFLPLYLAQMEKRGRTGASAYASNLLSIGVIVLGSVALLATIFAPQVIFTQTFMTQALTAQIAVFFFRFFAIQMVFYGIGAIISGLLNAHRSFLWPALGPVFNNICVIITFFGYPFISKISWQGGMVWLSVGTTLGVVAMFASQIPALRKLRIPLRFKINLRDSALKETVRMALPATVFIIMNLIVISVQNAFALNVTAQGPATIAYAWLWFALPYGVLGVALSTALFTEMSEASAAGNWKRFRGNVRLGMRTTIFMIIPLALIILTLSNQLAGLYHAGQFTYDDVLNVARVLACWCLALPFYAVYMFIYRAFSSLRKLNRFIIIDACGRVLQASLYALLTSGIGTFGSWGGLGLIGIPLADAITYALLGAAMSIALRRQIGSFGLGRIILDSLKILIAATLAIAIPFIISIGDNDQTIAISLVTIVLCGLFSLAVFYLLCRLFRVPEIALVNSIARGALRRIRKQAPENEGG